MKNVGSHFQTYNLIEISKSRMLWNFDFLEELSAQKMIPVLKSNAYGHGIEQVTEVLKDREFPYIAVNSYEEALRARAVSNQPLLIMGAIDPSDVGKLSFDNFTFLVQDLSFVEALGAIKKPINIHIDIDTGMKRYGFEQSDLRKLLDMLSGMPNLKVEGVCTHLADGDNPKEDFTSQQTQKFDEAVEQVRKAGHEPEWIHISNTPGLLKVKSKYGNSFRAGIGLYGINPLQPEDIGYEKLNQLKPALKLISTITFVRQLQPGESISYGRTWKADKPTTIAVLPLGYYEGIPRSLSSKGVVTDGEKTYKIVGRVCMNHLMIDITGSNLKVGDKLVVISDNPMQQNSVSQMSQDYYFFSYGLLAKLSSDIRRTVVK